MATNPMQKKARNSFVLGVLITFVIMAMIVVVLLLQVKKMKDMLGLYNELTAAADKYKQSQRHEKNHIKFILDNISCE